MAGSPSLRERALEAAVAGALPMLRLASRGSGKLARGVRARARAADHLIGWHERARDPRRPLLWVHAPSVGEALMAKAIIAALRVRLPDAQVLFTYFSPSAERIAESVGADVSGYLPWDTTNDAGRAVAALRPAALACVRTEVWPRLARATREAGGGVALVNAVLSETSGRLRAPARWFLEPMYSALDAVGVVTADDESRFRRLGVPAERIRLTGDARFDQVWQRATALAADRTRVDRLRALVPAGRSVVVAGSTWPADETVLVDAATRLADLRPLWVVAPHEPDEDHLRALEQRLADAGLRTTRMRAAEAGEAIADALVVDRVGVLADLYAIADVAYVGGGFHDQGLHSVVEPAALEVPVVFGPRLGNAREATDLARTGGGVQVAGAAALHTALRRWLSDGTARARAADAARRFVTERLGGAERNAALVAELVETRARREGIV